MVACAITLAATLLFAVLCPLQAEQLPIKTYTTADGLGSSYIHHIYRDRRGFIWLSTREGLSRFDGYRFVTYGTEHGLPNPVAQGFIEAQNGVYLVLTNQGRISRFKAVLDSTLISLSPNRDNTDSLFVVYPEIVGGINTLHQGPSGRLWAGGGQKLFYFDEAQNRFLEIASDRQLFPFRVSLMRVTSLVEDREGSLWIGTTRGLLRRLPDGRGVYYSILPTDPEDRITALMIDHEERLWIGHMTAGLFIFNPDSLAFADPGEPIPRRVLVPNPGRRGTGDKIVRLPSAPGSVCAFTTHEGMASDRINFLFQSSDGRIWIGSPEGLTEFDGRRFKSYSTRHGLSANYITAVTEDRHENLWIGTPSGLMKMPLHGFTTFDEEDGLKGTRIHAIFEDASGNLSVVSGNWILSRFDGWGFISIYPEMPKGVALVWASQGGFLDHTGQWWLHSDKGLARLPKRFVWKEGMAIQPEMIYTRRNGLLRDWTWRLFEDSAGNLWVSINRFANDVTGLVRWERATGSFHSFTEADGLPAGNPVSAFCEDRHGNFWFGFYHGGLARFRDGRFTLFTSADGVPAQFITALHVDQAGRVWVATNESGVNRMEDPTAEHPSFVRYTIAEGLASNNVRCLTEDRWGRIYLGTARGVDRLDPATGLVKHYTSADGLGGDFVTAARYDRLGRLWFGTANGVSRLVATVERPTSPPPIYISSVRIAGHPLPLSELGETQIPELKLKPGQNNIQIDFFSLSFEFGEKLSYQFRLEGADQDWSAPGNQRTVHYASLSPGTYRFMVKAISTSGLTSPNPAMVEFTILPPFYQRWWFIAMSIVLIVGIVIGLERLRAQRLLETERLRSSIATDLHDDIGAGLTHIGLLSEVMLQRYPLQPPHASGKEPKDEQADSSPMDSKANLEEIIHSMARVGTVARELSAAMSDVVWSINPRYDSLEALLHRLTAFACEICQARNIELKFEVPKDITRLKLNPEMRRSLLLIAKEALNNLAKYSDSPSAVVRIELNDKVISLTVEDHGKGFDLSHAGVGNGLVNMRTRAEKLHGRCEIHSEIGQGTRVKVMIPVK